MELVTVIFYIIKSSGGAAVSLGIQNYPFINYLLGLVFRILIEVRWFQNFDFEKLFYYIKCNVLMQNAGVTFFKFNPTSSFCNLRKVENHVCYLIVQTLILPTVKFMQPNKFDFKPLHKKSHKVKYQMHKFLKSIPPNF